VANNTTSRRSRRRARRPPVSKWVLLLVALCGQAFMQVGFELARPIQNLGVLTAGIGLACTAFAIWYGNGD
jgi:hypothetical protein